MLNETFSVIFKHREDIVNTSLYLRSKHEKTSCITDNKLLTSLISNEPETVLALPDTSLPEKKYKIVKTLSDLYQRQLVGIVDWAKRIPGKSKARSKLGVFGLADFWINFFGLTQILDQVDFLGSN